MRTNLRIAIVSIVIGLWACFAGAAPSMAYDTATATPDLSTFSYNTGGTSATTPLVIPPSNSGAGNDGLTFNFTTTGTLLAMQSGTAGEQATAAQVVQGFQDAADRWSAIFVDNVTVNIDIDYGAIRSGVLGGAFSERGTVTYNEFRTALVDDKTTSYDTTATANLPSGSSFSVYINRTNNNPNNLTNPYDPKDTSNEMPYLDNNGGANNTTIWMTRANAKAIGLLGADDGDMDASITFTDFSDFETPYPTNLDWDFDSSDGVGSSSIDFVGVATHEIGHVLGFISGVDILDGNSPTITVEGETTIETFHDDDAFTYVAPLDIMRVSDDSITASADIDWTADERAKFFSTNGGEDEIAPFSTGRLYGDGNQNSHWKDNLGLGLMDPTTGNGEIPIITDLDTMALDVIGWDFVPVPEPATMSLLAMGGLALLQRRKH